MSMFDKYDNLDPKYIPNNTTPQQNPEVVIVDKEPFIAYNIKGNPIGLSWTHGAEFELPYTVRKTITVKDNAILYDEIDQGPTINTVGVVGQKAYNTAECISWTCVEVVNNQYKWVEDDELFYIAGDSKEIILTPDMANKTFEVLFYNFRWEPVYSLATTNAADLVLELNKDTNAIFKPGVYYSASKITGENEVTFVDKATLIVL